MIRDEGLIIESTEHKLLMDQKTPANSPFAIARIQSGILTREKMLCVVGCAEMRKVDYESEDNKGC